MLKHIYISVILVIVFVGYSVHADKKSSQNYYVSPIGSDTNSGTAEKPFASLEKARDQIALEKSSSKGPVTVILKNGTYFLKETFILESRNSGTMDNPIAYKAENEGKAVISGASLLKNLDWRKHKNGIYKAHISRELMDKNKFDELWANDRKLSMARFPNADPTAHIFDGVTSVSVLNSRAKNYKNPTTGFVHALQKFEWGSVHYQVSGFAKNELQLSGGWQQNRNQQFKSDAIMIENVFEELDAPGEWFLDKNTQTLYVFPPEGIEVKNSDFYSVNLTNLIEYRGSATNPVSYVHFDGIEFRHSRRFFTEEYEPLLRGDWSVNRSGAVLMSGTENCQVSNCYFKELGGNGVFLDGYNRYSNVKSSHFESLGESAVCFVGNYAAIRSNPIGYENSYSYDTLDVFPGPKGEDFPRFCKMENCLVFAIGRVGKQTAGAFISMSESITIRHNTIYHVPRSGITVNDGSWGGHVIEYNHIFNSVIETGDHGPFNSWGRDRYWLTRHHGGEKGDQSGALERSKLDNHLTTVIRHNRFEHGAGFSWGIDLDDGTSNYHVYNNLLLGCSYKLREGFYRIVENNISIGPNPPGKHVCFDNNQDIIRNNIHVATDPSRVVYRGIISAPKQLREMNYNLYYATYGAPVIRNDNSPSEDFKTTMTLEEWKSAGLDEYSAVGNPMFEDPENYDFRVKKESPALTLGFKNFSMNEFGVQKPTFVAIVEKDYKKYREFDPSILRLADTDKQNLNKEDEVFYFIGAHIEDLNTESEKSVAGVGELRGVFVKAVDEFTDAAGIGLEAGDAILSINNIKIKDSKTFISHIQESLGTTIELHLVGAKDRKVKLKLPIKL